MKKILFVFLFLLPITLSPVQGRAATTGFELLWTKSSAATAEVIDNNNGTWSYNFTVYNTSTAVEVGSGEGNGVPYIIDWEFPFFNTAGVQYINSPSTWNHSVETIGTPNPAGLWEGIAQWLDPADPLYRADSPFNSATQVLHWFNQTGLGIGPGNSQSGFSIIAGAGPIDAPYQASWDYGPVVTGDPPVPFRLPTPQTGPVVPEPSTIILTGLGLAFLGVRGRIKN